MKTAVKVFKILMLLLGGFFILMSFDSFDGTDTFWNMVIEFIMNSLPGVVLIGLTISLWKYDLILGIIILAGAFGLFFLFKFYRDFDEKLITVFTVEVPMLASGILLVVYGAKNKKT